MSYAASSGFLNPPIFSSYSPLSIGYITAFSGQTAGANTAWGTANQARYVPFHITQPYLVRKLLCYCGTTNGGNNDMALYDAAGTRVIGATAAAHPGAAGWQEFDVTDTLVMPGLYFLGLLNTTTTATFSLWTNAINKEMGRLAGVYSQAVGAGTMPSPTATFAALDAAAVPVVAMSSRVLI